MIALLNQQLAVVTNLSVGGGLRHMRTISQPNSFCTLLQDSLLQYRATSKSKLLTLVCHGHREAASVALATRQRQGKDHMVAQMLIDVAKSDISFHRLGNV